MRSSDERPLDQTLEIRVLRLQALAQGVALGILAGGGILVATLVLVIRGGSVVGPHLALLSQFLPGYTVTVTGSVVGLAWGIGYGFVAGWLVSTLYNRFATRRETR